MAAEAATEDSGSRWSGALALALACALLAGASFGILVLDFGAHVDGPGIGLEWSRPLGSEYGPRAGVVLLVAVVQAALSIAAFRGAPAKPIGFLALPGLAFVGMFAGFVAAGRALPAWWGWGCSSGHAYACYAAGGVTDGPESEALDDRACSGDVGVACHRIARGSAERRSALCATRAATCTGPVAARERHGRCNALDEVCGASDRAPASSEDP